MRTMTVVHHREIRFDDRLQARTWLREFRRNTLTSREIRLELEGEVAIAATQQWVHVDRSLRPARASETLTRDFVVHDEGEPVVLPRYEPCQGGLHRLELEAWHTWMDPHDHMNHPLYLDLCDESTSRVMAAAGLDPMLLHTVAETMTFRSGVHARERITVESRLRGVTANGDAVIEHQLRSGERLCVEAITVRRAGSATATLIEALSGETPG